MEDREYTSEIRPRALLLLGPTGSSKTPLGQLIEQRGLWQTRCLHFDFGANLRDVVSQDRPDELIGREDLDFLQEVLNSGALLENEHFPLAERILRRFLTRREADRHTLVVLNGLPRHVDQAQAVDAILDVQVVVHLHCTSRTVIERIRENVGGDRTGRTDDDLEAVGRKLAVFHQRTAPMLTHYSHRGARIIVVEVTATMTSEQIWEFAFSPDS